MEKFIPKTGTLNFAASAPKAPVVSALPKAPAAAKAGKDELEKKLKAAEKAVLAVCEEIQKKILAKAGNADGAAEVGGLNKEDLMKLVAVLDSIGSTTYPIACALRDIQNRMR